MYIFPGEHVSNFNLTERIYSRCSYWFRRSVNTAVNLMRRKIRRIYQFAVKGKGHPMTCLCRHRGEAEVRIYIYIAPTHSKPGNRRKWVVSSTIRPLCPVNDSVPVVEEVVGLAAGLNGLENRSLTGIRSPDLSVLPSPYTH